jgi:hypothetical protein
MLDSPLTRIKERIHDKGIYWALFSVYRYFSNTKKLYLEDFVRSNLVVDGHTLSNAIYTRIYKQFINKQLGEGIAVMKKDWDNLILLDAYRYDYF